MKNALAREGDKTLVLAALLFDHTTPSLLPPRGWLDGRLVTLEKIGAIWFDLWVRSPTSQTDNTSSNMGCYTGVMNRVVGRGLLGLGVAVILGEALHAQQAPLSLADVAEQERARRANITDKAKVYTNDDLRGGPRLTTGTPVSTTAEPDPEAPGPTPVAAETTTDEDEEQIDRGEDYWRARILTARDARQRAELMAAALQNRVDGLWAAFTARDDPFQRAEIEQDRIDALRELEATRADVVELDQQIRDIQEEARRAGVPPGWLR